jgi:hypothetical protein
VLHPMRGLLQHDEFPVGTRCGAGGGHLPGECQVSGALEHEGRHIDGVGRRRRAERTPARSAVPV